MMSGEPWWSVSILVMCASVACGKSSTGGSDDRRGDPATCPGASTVEAWKLDGQLVQRLGLTGRPAFETIETCVTESYKYDDVTRIGIFLSQTRLPDGVDPDAFHFDGKGALRLGLDTKGELDTGLYRHRAGDDKTADLDVHLTPEATAGASHDSSDGAFGGIEVTFVGADRICGTFDIGDRWVSARGAFAAERRDGYP